MKFLFSAFLWMKHPRIASTQNQNDLNTAGSASLLSKRFMTGPGVGAARMADKRSGA